MNRHSKIWLAIIRLSLGWLMFYAGITKIMDPEWTAEGYAKSAKTLPALYEWFASPANMGWIDFINKWGLTLLGISLILGIGVRLSSALGAVLMLSYYLPVLDFPYAGEHSFIVDEHVIYIGVLIFFAVERAGRHFGLEKWFGKTFFKRLPKLQKYWG
ncbi:DoxX family protein [Patescibacteria group bacterium]|nr:DoxX family protein [Patescibacteria group bacterium]